MIDAISTLEQIKNIPKDTSLYLLEKLSEKAGFFASNGDIVYIVRNEESCSPLHITTDRLCLITDVEISAATISSTSFSEGHYNLLKYTLIKEKEAVNDLDSFISLCATHARHIEGLGFVQFFESLISMFQLPREQEYKSLLGLWGELFFMKKISELYGLDISNYWQTGGTYSKYDFTLPNCNIDSKTTKNNRIFEIKHEQLFAAPDDNYLCALTLVDDNSGLSLNDLICELHSNPSICNTLHFELTLERERRKVSPKEAAELRFSVKDWGVYKAAQINVFEYVPEEILKLTYNLDLSCKEKKKNAELKNLFMIDKT